MNRSLKAALLSALVFPGIGQFYLGKRALGWLFALPTLLAALYFISSIYERINHIVDDITSGRLDPDLLLVLERVHQQEIATPAMNLAVLVMIGCWLASIVHAALAARVLPPV